MYKIHLFFLMIPGIISPQLNPINFRIFPSSVTQTEPILAINNANPQLFFVSAVTINTSNGFKSEGIYVSTNSGANWFGSDTCKGQILLNHGGDPGIVVTANKRLVLTHIGSVFPGVYSHFSDDLGVTWSNALTITNQQTDDKGTTLIDDNPNSPYFGRIYSAFVKLISPYPIYFSYSSNSAGNWSNPTIINNQPPARCTGPTMVIDSNGKIFAVWAGVTSLAPFIEDYIGFAVSSDGGNSWTVTNNIIDVNGINGTLTAKSNIRVNGLPRMAIDKSNGLRNGYLYIVTTEKNNLPAGSDPDVILRYSSNSGQTWSSGIRVNQDALNNGKIQYFPAIDVDVQGNLNIIYYDDRNTSSDSAEVYLSRSSDGGNTWTDQPISDHRFKPKPVIGGSSNYQGDYISLISSGQKLYACWMDDFSGIYQIWMKIINIETDVDEDSQMGLTKGFNLNQNFPNPFNPITKISWQSQIDSWQTIKVYDVLGNEVKVLSDKFTTAGQHEISFSASDDLPSGVYFYKLQVENFIQTKKMILMK